MAYDLGDVVTVVWVFGSAATVVATVTLPDGTTASATVSGTSTYTATYTSVQAGRHVMRMVASGAAVGAHTDTFDVLPADPGFIVSMQDVRDALNIPTGVTANDEELRRFLAAATPVVEEIAGPVVRATKTWTTSGGRTALAVPHSQLASVSSVVVNGSTLTPGSDYITDLPSGLIYAGTRSAPSRFAAGDVVITYVVGAGAGSNVWLAACELVRFWWQQGQQTQGRPAFGGTVDVGDYVSSAGYAVPRRVIELLSPNAPAPGIG